jgi:hypothetical protein
VRHTLRPQVSSNRWSHFPTQRSIPAHTDSACRWHHHRARQTWSLFSCLAIDINCARARRPVAEKHPLWSLPGLRCVASLAHVLRVFEGSYVRGLVSWDMFFGWSEAELRKHFFCVLSFAHNPDFFSSCSPPVVFGTRVSLHAFSVLVFRPRPHCAPTSLYVPSVIPSLQHFTTSCWLSSSRKTHLATSLLVHLAADFALHLLVFPLPSRSCCALGSDQLSKKARCRRLTRCVCAVSMICSGVHARSPQGCYELGLAAC